ncbi:hypothetical protein [Paenibacillus sp. MBLB4367]|uniref:hypothetical protein n=1 Tax=Paenibacillus sp. MBLB4367 TaxID=3384767 RepID=UPI0039082B28
MEQEVLERIRSIVKEESGSLRGELMDRFDKLNEQIERLHIRIDNLHNEMYVIGREWSERFTHPDERRQKLGADARRRCRPDLSGTSSLSSAEQCATKEDIRFLASKIGVRDMEIDFPKR